MVEGKKRVGVQNLRKFYPNYFIYRKYKINNNFQLILF